MHMPKHKNASSQNVNIKGNLPEVASKLFSSPEEMVASTNRIKEVSLKTLGLL